MVRKCHIYKPRTYSCSGWLFKALWNVMHPVFAEVIHVFMWIFTIVSVWCRVLLGKQREKQTAFFCYSYFFSVSAVIVSLVPVKRQLPFAGEGMLPEQARCLIPNCFLRQRDLKALSAAGGSHSLSRPGPASQIKATRLLPVVKSTQIFLTLQSHFRECSVYVWWKSDVL